MSTGSLANKLTTLRKSLTKSSRGSTAIPDAHSLYLAALQAVFIPVLGVGASGAGKNPSSILDVKDLKPTNHSIVKDNTIFLCKSTMEAFKTNILLRIEIMESIQTFEARAFYKSGKRYGFLEAFFW